MALPALLAPILSGAASAGGAYLANKGLSSIFGGDSGMSQASAPGSFLQGRAGGLQKVPRYSGDQERAFNSLLRQGLEGIQNPTAGFEPYAQRARQNFQSQTVPSLLERFSAGTGGALSSPSLASQLGAAGSQLESNLATGAADYGLQNRQQLMQLLQLGLSPQFDYQQTPEQAGALSSMAPQLLQLLPLLARFAADYNISGKDYVQGSSPFWETLSRVLGGKQGE